MTVEINSSDSGNTAAPSPSNEELELIADRLKTLGNEAFREKRFQDALRFYSQVLSLHPNDHKVISNRSATFLALGDYPAAVADGLNCTKIDPSWAKGYYRLGCALMSQERWDEASRILSKGWDIDASSKDMRAKLREATAAAESEKQRIKAQVKMYRRNIVLKLQDARRVLPLCKECWSRYRTPFFQPFIHHHVSIATQHDAREALINRFKQTMTAPEWEIEDYEWRPTFLPSMRLQTADPSNLQEDYASTLISGYINAVADLEYPKQSLRLLRDAEWLNFHKCAMKDVIKQNPECHVVIIDSGCGILGLIAAQLGASRVTCIEPSHSMYNIAKATIERNKDAVNSCTLRVSPRPLKHCAGNERVPRENHAVNGQSGNVEDAEVLDLADVLVMGMIDPSMLGQSVLSCLDFASAHLASVNCTVVPSKLHVNAVLVDTTVTTVLDDFDLTYLNRYLWHPNHQRTNLNTLRHTRLSDPITVLDLDLQSRLEKALTVGTSETSQQDGIYDVAITHGGSLNGVAFWVEAFSLDEEQQVTNSYGGAAHHGPAGAWHQALQYVDEIPVQHGEKVEIRCAHNASGILFSTQPPASRPRHATLPGWHFDMVQDDQRNKAYDKAIRSAIEYKRASGEKEVVVLDAGAGSGLLSLMAARAGADQVFAVEVTSHVADLCEEVVTMNGFVTKAKIINKDVRHINMDPHRDPEMEQKADILVMEVFDSGLIGEGALHIFAAAQQRLLNSNAILVPSGARVFLQPLQLNRIADVCEFDMQHINSFRWRPSYEGTDLRSNGHTWQPLADPQVAFAFDFYQHEENLKNGSIELSMRVKKGGILNAVAFWFDLFLGEETALSTSPYECGIGATWQQAVQWVGERRVEEGMTLTLNAKHDTYGITFEVVDCDGEATGLPLMDPVWKQKFDQMDTFNQKLVKSISQNPLEYRRLATAAVRIGARPQDFNVDAHHAADFCVKMLG